MLSRLGRVPLLGAFLGALLCALLAGLSLVALAAQAPTARLTIYSDGSAIGTEGSSGLVKGHSFLVVKNLTRAPIVVGKMSGIESGETVTLGSFGNRKEHAGIWYNLESWTIHQNLSAYSTGSLSRDLSAAELAKMNNYIASNDSYDALDKNCSTFAAGAWNATGAEKLSAGWPQNNPTSLFDNITKKQGAIYGESVGIPWTSRGVWRANGTLPPVRSTSYPDAAPRISFDDFAVGTPVSDQYKDRGVLFAGDPGPRIADDSANPTSPVLSPASDHQGTVDLTFVRPQQNAIRGVASNISFDLGYIDRVSGATISWYTATGKQLGTMSTKDLGIVRIVVPGPASRLRVDTRPDVMGAALDNLSFTVR